MSLARKAVIGGLWLGGVSWIGFFASFAGRVVLVRLLLPEDFGIYALALSIVETLFLFFGFSFSMAAINLSDERDVFDTAMWLSIGAGFLVAIFGLILSLIISNYYGLLIAKIVVILSGIQIFKYTAYIYSAYQEKDLVYKNISIVKGISRPTGFVVAILLVWFFNIGVWALVLVEVLAAVVLFFGQRGVSGYRFRRKFNSDTARKICRFSYKMFLNRMLEMGYSRIPLFLIGSLLGTTYLGYFSQAYYLVRLPNTFLTSILVKLNFAVFSKVRNNKKQLEQALSISNFIVIRVMALSVVLIFLFPEFIIEFLFTAKWLPSAPILQKLSLFLLFYPLFNLMKSFNYAQRKHGIMTRAFLQSNFLLYILIAMCIVRNTTSYLPYAFVFSISLPLLYLYWQLNKQGIPLNPVRNLVYPVVFGAALIALKKLYIHPVNVYLEFGIIILLYISALFLKDRKQFTMILKKVRVQH